jgi:membrane associated rhomboid family serine protease
MKLRLAGRPTIDTLLLFLLVFAAQQLLSFVSIAAVTSLFVLNQPVEEPLAMLVSVYAHNGVMHLVSNAIGLVLFGLVVERVTSRFRFHLFFVAVGALSGVAEVYAQSAFGGPAGVIGASGAVLGLLGYLITGNQLADAAVGRLRLSGKQQALIFGVVAVAITYVTVGPNVAVVGHFTGLVLGLLAGRLKLLHVR